MVERTLKPSRQLSPHQRHPSTEWLSSDNPFERWIRISPEAVWWHYPWSYFHRCSGLIEQWSSNSRILCTDKYAFPTCWLYFILELSNGRPVCLLPWIFSNYMFSQVYCDCTIIIVDWDGVWLLTFFLRCHVSDDEEGILCLNFRIWGLACRHIGTLWAWCVTLSGSGIHLVMIQSMTNQTVEASWCLSDKDRFQFFSFLLGFFHPLGNEFLFMLSSNMIFEVDTMSK